MSEATVQQTEDQKKIIAHEWLQKRAPQDFFHDGKMKSEYVAFLNEYIAQYHAGILSLDNLDSGVAYLRMRQSQQKDVPVGPTPQQKHDAAVGAKWISDRCPEHLLNEKRNGIGNEAAQKMSDYLKVNYNNVWTLENLDKACHYLQLRGELSDGISKVSDRAISTEAASLTGLVSHARPEEKPTSTADTSFASFAKSILKKAGRAQDPPKAPEPEKLRAIPANATAAELKKYNAQEIRNWLAHKRAQTV